MDDDASIKVKSEKKRDTSRYSFNGKSNLTKGRLAQEIVRRYVLDHPDVTFEELTQIFNKETVGARDTVMFFDEAKMRKISKGKIDIWHFVKTNEDKIRLKEGNEAVSTQWGLGIIIMMIAVAKQLGYNI